MKIREECARKVLGDALEYLSKDGGEVAIFDATNVSVERRKMIRDMVVQENSNYQVSAFGIIPRPL